MRVANLKPGPGQETAVTVTKASNALKAPNNSTIAVQWIPRSHKCAWKRSYGSPSKESHQQWTPRLGPDLSCPPEAYGMRQDDGGSIPQKGRTLPLEARQDIPERQPDPDLNHHTAENRPRILQQLSQQNPHQRRRSQRMQLQRRTNANTGTPHPEVLTTRQSADNDAKGGIQNPQAASHLLLNTNMGAEALEDYQSGNQTVETWYQRQTSGPLDEAHSTSPRMNITTAPAGGQETRRRRRMEGSEEVAADID